MQDVLYAKLQRLRRLLPEVDVVRMAIKEPRVLEMDLTLATGNLIMLLEALPGQDISAAVAEFPRALMMRDLRERLDVTLGRLTEWSHASIVHAVSDRRLIGGWEADGGTCDKPARVTIPAHIVSFTS